MKKITFNLCLVSALILLSINIKAQGFRLDESCLFVSVADSKSIFVGINEDNLDMRSHVWFIPGNNKAYGRVLWGFDRGLFRYQGGMNERGLMVDLNTTGGYTGWKADPKKSNLDISEDLFDYLLSNFTTVDEAIDFFNKYNIDLSGVMYVFADANRKSVIIEVVDGELRILKKDQGYLICTNNVQSDIDIPNTYPCDRWRIADQILKGQNTPSVDLIRQVLSATSAQFYFIATCYSAICDIVNRKIYLYNFHNYEEVVVFDLKSELAKGGTNYSFQELFKVQPYSFVTQKRIGVQWGDQNLKQVIDERGIEEGIKELQRMKDVKRTYEKYIFQEWVLKAVGQQYLEEKKYDFAIEVFKLNVQEYPASSTVYSDLAEAYLNINNTTLAIQNYRKAVELDLSDYVSIKKLRLLQQVDPGEIVNPLFTKTIKEGIQEGYEVFLEMKNSNTAPAELFINAVGYNLLNHKRLDDAIKIFELNVKAFPGSANTFDSLSEAYENHGDINAAILNYKRALEINPSLESSKAALNRLEKKK